MSKVEFNWNESYEFLAKRFREETGFMAPGKDVPAVAHYSKDEEKSAERNGMNF